MQRHRNDMRHREALQRRYLGDPKYMTEEELDRYISERLGQRRASSLNFGDWRDLRARYRWVGEKLFDTGASCDPCFLTCGAFILFALDPSIEMLSFLQIRTASEYVKTFEKLVELNRHIPWEDVYEYFDETRYYQFNVLQDILIKYRDKLLKIDVNMFPNGRRLITHQKVPNYVVKELLNQKLHEVGYDIDNMTKKEVTTAISRYRWFGDDLLDIYEGHPISIFRHRETRFLVQIFYPSISPVESRFMAPSTLSFRRPAMTGDEKIKYDTPEPNRPWGQIWGYVVSRPKSIDRDTQAALKLQLHNQFSYDMI